MKSGLIAASLASLLIFSISCEPDDVPVFSPDGKYVVMLLDLEEKAKDREEAKKPRVPGKKKEEKEKEPKPKIGVGVVEIKTGKLKKYDLSGKWTASGITCLGNRIMIAAVFLETPDNATEKEKEKENEKKKSPSSCYFEIDAASGKLSKTGIMSHIFEQPFLCNFGNQAAIFTHGFEEGKKTIVLEAGNTSNILATLKFNAFNLGQNLIMKTVGKEIHNGLVKVIVKIEIYEPKIRKVVEISQAELAKACYRDARFPKLGRVSSDKEKVYLVFDTETIFRQHSHEYTFGVYYLKTGELLWKGASNPLKGVPAFIGDKIFAIEAKKRNIYTGDRSAASMFSGPAPRYGATDKAVLAVHSKEGRKVVLDLPLKKGDIVRRYSHSQDMKKFVLLVEGDNPRLMIIPIKESLKADKISEIKLPELKIKKPDESKPK